MKMKFITIIIWLLFGILLNSEQVFAQKFLRGAGKKAKPTVYGGVVNSARKNGGKVIDDIKISLPTKTTKGLDDVPTSKGGSNLNATTKSKSDDYTDEIRGQRGLINTKIPANKTDFIDIKNKLISSGNKPLNGYPSKSFLNREGKLPKQDKNGKPITYTEHDIYMPQKNQDRGINRIVYGSDGSYYYTTDHYNTFTRF